MSKGKTKPRKVVIMFTVDLFLEMHELCRSCSKEDRVSEYQTLDLMIDATTINRMKKGERLFWFVHKNGTHANSHLQTLERLHEFYTDPAFARTFTSIYVIDCISYDNYKFYPLTDLHN